MGRGTSPELVRARRPPPPDDVRVCVGCGRGFDWRPALATSWSEVRWCSAACRRRGLRPVDAALESAVLELLDAGASGATIGPSDVASRVAGEADPDAAHGLMEPARRAARRLVAAGAVEILQDGRVVDASRAKGDIRIR